MNERWDPDGAYGLGKPRSIPPVSCRHCAQPLPSGRHACRGEVVGFTGGHPSWRGRVRLPDGTVLYECQHTHRNRDQSSYTWGQAATPCAADWLRRDQMARP